MPSTKQKPVNTETDNSVQTCIVPECTAKAHCRGLCIPCRAQAKKMIDAGEATEAEIVERGLMLPKKGTSKFKKAFGSEK